MNRYEKMGYRRCGRSGVDLPVVSLGLWHNFGGGTFETARAIAWAAFDAGITHFDLANNYGPPPGSAEETFGRILAEGLGTHRDELIIATKAGHRMHPGPYGDGGSRKYLLSSLDASLRRMGLDYVDIYYHHRPDPSTPIEETMGALASAVQQGKALYAGISNYGPGHTAAAVAALRSLGAPLLIHQARYSIFDRRPEAGLLDTLSELGTGCIAFSPLEQGILAGKYNEGIPPGSRAAAGGFLRPEQVTPEKVARARAISSLAAQRGQSPAQLALAWVLRKQPVVSALIGASDPAQIADCVACLEAPPLTDDELRAIDLAGQPG